MDLSSEQQSGAGRGTADIVAWRRAQLRKAGFDSKLAEELSHECSIDLHALIGLVERDCPPPLAARILAPLDHERHEC